MKRLILTWWSDWLWKEISKIFFDEWYQVICLSRKKPEWKCIHIKTDISKEEDIRNAIAIIKDKGLQ